MKVPPVSVSLHSPDAVTAQADQDDAAMETIPVPGTICLWKVDLDCSVAELMVAKKILSLEEQQHAARFHKPSDQKKFTAARAFLRLILGRYLEIDPAKIEFVLNGYGKPGLRGETDIRFNMAHSGNKALCAIALGEDVGVDLELMRPDVALMDIARRCFADQEIEQLSALEGDDLVAAFYRCWTRKEAYVKAIGLGFSFPLNSFIVSANANETISVCDESKRQWIIQDVAAGDPFAAALAFVESKKIPRRIIERECSADSVFSS